MAWRMIFSARLKTAKPSEISTGRVGSSGIASPQLKTEPLAWTAMLLEDFRSLLTRGVKGTSALVDPLVGADAWAALMSNAGKWKQVATDFHYCESCCDRKPHTDPSSLVHLFTCVQCQNWLWHMSTSGS